MHGQAVFTDEVLRTVEKELTKYMQDEKLDIFAQPLPLSGPAPCIPVEPPRREGDRYAYRCTLGGAMQGVSSTVRGDPRRDFTATFTIDSCKSSFASADMKRARSRSVWYRARATSRSLSTGWAGVLVPRPRVVGWTRGMSGKTTGCAADAPLMPIPFGLDVKLSTAAARYCVPGNATRTVASALRAGQELAATKTGFTDGRPGS